MNKRNFMRKTKYAIWIPRKINRKPKGRASVISDLFPLRSDSNWQTHFELLNVAGLISGDNSLTQRRMARFVLFNCEGEKLAEKMIPIPKSGRQTVNLDSGFHASILEASAFAVFHEYSEPELEIGNSFLAERGYTGYSRKHAKIRAYVHGNLDSIAFCQGEIQAIGNRGLFPRHYTVQHPLRGPAIYEFYLSNPTPHSVSIKIQHCEVGGTWKGIKHFKLRSMGNRILRIEKKDDSPSFIRIRSRLYLGRPVVFRLTDQGFDVFHG